MLEPSLLVVVSATWRKEDTERKGSFAFGSELSWTQNLFVPFFFQQINKVGSTIYLVCR